MQLPMLPTVCVYFRVFSVVSPLPASQELKGKESPFRRAALAVGFCLAAAEGFILTLIATQKCSILVAQVFL